MEDIDMEVNQRFRYCDYYSLMSYADFRTWVDRNDGSEPDIDRVQADDRKAGEMRLRGSPQDGQRLRWDSAGGLLK
jgi:hypothetical protein